jgi:hypothetical protein
MLEFPYLGWNDPPKNVGPPQGNLKINLNKRVAFPLGSDGSAQASGLPAGPLLLPPKPPTATHDAASSESSIELCSEVNLDSKKEDILQIFMNGIQELNTSVQSSVTAKLKTLEEDWSECDVEMKKLLIELANCEFSSIMLCGCLEINFYFSS